MATAQVYVLENFFDRLTWSSKAERLGEGDLLRAVQAVSLVGLVREHRHDQAHHELDQDRPRREVPQPALHSLRHGRAARTEWTMNSNML